MKVIALLLASAITILPAVTAHAESTCGPKSDVRWREGQVTWLKNSAQALYQVRARGNFLTADLICNYEECVGFIGGSKAVGHLILGDENQALGFTLQYDGEPSSAVEFTCQ